MRLKLLYFTFFIVSLCSAAFSLRAQTIQAVPNPDQPDIFAYVGGPLSGYAGNPIILNS